MSNLDLSVWFRFDLDRVMYRALGVLVLGGTLGLCLRDFLSTAAAALALRKSRILSDAAGARWAASTEGSVNRAGGLPKHEWPADAFGGLVREFITLHVRMSRHPKNMSFN